MKRLLAGLLIVPILTAAVFLSRPTPAGNVGGGGGKDASGLLVKQDAINPWNNLKLNNSEKTFRFAIVADRTGGARKGVFEKAVDQLNLLQPEFIVSVGDLIEGYTEEEEKITQQWKEFNDIIAKLQMPFFYVPGNHDVTNRVLEKRWQEQFGRLWYHFRYKDVLFVLLNSDDEADKKPTIKIGPKQIAEIKKALADNKDVSWTLVFLHRPVWHSMDVKKIGWLEIEEALKDRPYTVFAGHEHKYIREVRNERKYYTFATTGGSSKLRGVKEGEFDHLIWVTMKSDGPVIVNLMMDGILPEDARVGKK